MFPRCFLIALALVMCCHETLAKTTFPDVFRMKRDAPAGAMGAFVEMGWKYSKYDFIKGFIQGATIQPVNITLVGWQKVLHKDGSLKEVREIRFSVPQHLDSAIVADETVTTHRRRLPGPNVNNIKLRIGLLSGLGLHTWGVTREFNTEGEVANKVFSDSEELYTNSNGFDIYDTTRTLTQSEIDALVDRVERKYKHAAVLKYDSEGKVQHGSKIHPYMLGQVKGFGNVSNEVLLAAPAMMGEVYSKSIRDEIPEGLTRAFNKRFPQWSWKVKTSSLISKDISGKPYVQVSFDNFDLDKDSQEVYLVYGDEVVSNALPAA